MKPIRHISQTSPPPIPEVDGWRIPWLGGTRWLLPVLVLVTLALRITLVSQNDVISRDGLFYISCAEMIESGEVQGIPDKYMLNPYPLLIVLVARTGIDYVLAGKLISTIAATLALLPLYWFCRSAFGRRVAELAALVYALHPALAHVSSEVLREGLYWLLAFSAIAVFWSATQKNSWWQFLIGGLLAIAATLTRVQGIVIFALAAMWWIARVWPHRRHLLSVTWKPALAVSTLCALVVILAMVLVPSSAWNKWQLVAMAREYAATHKSSEAKLTPADGVQAWESMSSRRSLKYLAEGLPAYQYKQERLLDLAKDHLWPLYASDLIFHITKAFEFPTLIFLFIGLIWGRERFWHAPRDWPLALHSFLVMGILIHHLATVHVISTRYTFALIPFVLPWSCLGFFQFSDWLQSRLEIVRRESWLRPATCGLVAMLAVFCVGRSFHYLRDGKSTERELGELIRETTGKKTVIACPKSLRRVPFYADSTFTKLMNVPREDLHVWFRKNAGWLKNHQVEYLLLDRENMVRSKIKMGREDIPQSLEPMFEGDPRFHNIRVFRVSDLPQSGRRMR